MSRVRIVDYGMGNLLSVAGAIRRAGAEPELAREAADLDEADRIVLPGVGAFEDGMRNLRSRGLVEPLASAVRGRRVPFLGICLGAQLLARESEEGGLHEGLGWLPARVARLETGDPSLRLPHIGWNEVAFRAPSPLWRNLESGTLFYFVHGYHLVPDREDLVVGTASYGRPVTAAARSGNIHAVQFHPEKSQKAGLDLLRNFLEGAD